MEPKLIHAWKVQVSARGVHLTLNGETYELGTSHEAIVFDLQRASCGYTVPERSRSDVAVSASTSNAEKETECSRCTRCGVCKRCHPPCDCPSA